MPTVTREENAPRSIVVSVLSARANLGKLLERVDTERRSLVIEKRGAPRAVLLSIRDYVKLATPEPEVLKLIGADAERNQTNALTNAKIEAIIKAARADRSRAKKSKL